MRTSTAFLTGASALLASLVPSVLAHGQIVSVKSDSSGSIDGPNVRISLLPLFLSFS